MEQKTWCGGWTRFCKGFRNVQARLYVLPYLGVEHLPIPYIWKNRRLQDWIDLGCYMWVKCNKVLHNIYQLLHHVQRFFPVCPFLFTTSPFDPLSTSQHIKHALLLSLPCNTNSSFLWTPSCCWNPFTRLKMKDVCLLFPQVYQRISNIPSSVGCAMQNANEVPSAALSIYFLGGIIFELS